MKRYSFLLIIEMIVLSVQCQEVKYRQCVVVASFYEESRVESRLLQKKVYNDRNQIIIEIGYNEDAKESGRTNFYYNDTLLILEDNASDVARQRKIYLYNDKGLINGIISEENERILGIEDYSYEGSNLIKKNFTEYNNGILRNISSEMYHYDGFGKLIEKSVTNNGRLTLNIQFEYTSEGKIKKEINFNRGVSEHKKLFNYSDNGNLIQVIYFHNGIITDSTNYYYDNQNNLIKTVYFSSGRLYSKIEKEYGENGLVTKIINTEYPKPLGRVVKDSAENQSEKSFQGEVPKQETITYYNNKDVVLEEYWENDRLISKTEYKYSIAKSKKK